MDTNPITPNPAPEENPPEKYIRTFAGDIETLKKGGVPDLAPLKKANTKVEPKKEKEERPMVLTHIVVPKPLPPIVPPVVPKLPPSKPIFAPKSPPPAPKPLPPVSPLQTYSGDFSQRMKDTNSTTATVLAAEQDSMKTAPQQPSAPKSSNTMWYVIGGIILLLAAGVGAYYAYTIYLVKMPTVIIAPVVSAPIFVDDRELLSGTGPALFQAISQSVGKSISDGAVRLLYIEASSTAPKSVFSSLHASAPDILLRNVNVSGSMAGVVNAGGTQSPFFILSVASYGDTFSGMLKWEPSIVNDLSQLFPAYPPPAIIPTAAPMTATSTKKSKKVAKTKIVAPATTTPPVAIVQLKFVDEVVANHDVRIYRDAQGQSILLYGYWNQSTLVIARDPAAFTEILQRLATSRTK